MDHGPWSNIWRFRDEDVAAKCETQCEIEYVECTLSCSNTNCLIECGRALTDCVQGSKIFNHEHHKNIILLDCPCNINCPNGCNDCSNPICVCGENPSPQNRDNFHECIREKSIDLGQCIIDCGDDESCEQTCVNLFKSHYDQCPCQVWKNFIIGSSRLYFKDHCPFGCPCESFDCQPDKKSVLVLNTWDSNTPVLIKFDGQLSIKS